VDEDQGVWAYALIVPGLLVFGVGLVVWGITLAVRRHPSRSPLATPAGVFLALVGVVAIYSALFGLGLAPIPGS